jgi:hypothetical protein
MSILASKMVPVLFHSSKPWSASVCAKGPTPNACATIDKSVFTPSQRLTRSDTAVLWMVPASARAPICGRYTAPSTAKRSPL